MNKNVVIGIQARTASERFPNKGMALLDGKPVLQHVIDSCNQAGNYLNRNFRNFQAMVKVILLTPPHDQYVKHFSEACHGVAFPLPEKDVLSRYYMIAQRENADYVVRITGDCPFVPSYLISRCIKSALINKCDYTSNVWVRTFPEGFDVEVISKKLIEWLNANAQSDEEREDVTSCLRREIPFPKLFNLFNVINDDLDLSHVKTSIDTEDDFERAEMWLNALNHKRIEAHKYGGIIC
jgi:spore coat polysaccharide biosynthesis protein SpsF (cytidylyltransferase family)